MGRLIRLDRTGHSTLAEWTGEERASVELAEETLAAELERGFIASATLADGSHEVVRQLPVDAALVTLRRPIQGG